MTVVLLQGQEDLAKVQALAELGLCVLGTELAQQNELTLEEDN